MLTKIKNNKNIIILSILYILSLIYILEHLYREILAGGAPYHQGDWLINNTLATVRRGIGGLILLKVSNIFSLNPLYLLGSIQAIIYISLFLSFLYVAFKLKNNDSVFFLLISPFFILFWIPDIEGACRKEIIAYFAFVPYFFVVDKAIKYKYYTVAISSIIYTIGTLTHEALIFFMPFYMLIVLIISGVDYNQCDYKDMIKNMLNNRLCVFAFIAYLIPTVFCMIYVFLIIDKVSPSIICTPILSIPDINPNICNGAVTYVDKGIEHGFNMVSSIFFKKSSLQSIILTTYFSFFIFYLTFNDILNIPRLYIFSLLTFIPLFIVAVDWGRFYNYHAFALTCTILIYILSNDFKYKRNTYSKFTYYSLLLVFLFAGIRHCAVPIVDYNISAFKTLAKYVINVINFYLQ